MMIRHFLMLLTLTSGLAPSCVAWAQTFETIAYWRFEQGANYLNDSSGNGYHLADPGVASFAVPAFSTDTPLVGAGFGSAQFDGTTSFTQTATPLLLSNYDRVRFSYWVKVETATQDLMLFENSFDSNFQVNGGSTFHLMNASGTPGGSALLAYRTGIGFPSAATTLDFATYDTLDEWHFVEVDYDFTQEVQDDRVKMKINDVDGTKLRPVNRPEEWDHLRDDTLYVGGRKEFAGNPSLLFTGKITEVKIEGVPGAVDPPGDFNDDDKVDGADFLLWQRGESPNQGDASDFHDWKSGFGQPSSPALAAATNVPEPGSGAGMLLMMLIAAASKLFFDGRRLSAGVKKSCDFR